MHPPRCLQFFMSRFYSFPTRVLALSDWACHRWDFNSICSWLVWRLFPGWVSYLPLVSRCRKWGLYATREALLLSHLACNCQLISARFSLSFSKALFKLAIDTQFHSPYGYYLPCIFHGLNFHSWLICSLLLLHQFTTSGLGLSLWQGRKQVWVRGEIDLQFSFNRSLDHPSWEFWRETDPSEMFWVGARKHGAFVSPHLIRGLPQEPAVALGKAAFFSRVSPWREMAL